VEFLIGRHNGECEKLARGEKGLKRLEIFHPSTNVKRKLTLGYKAIEDMFPHEIKHILMSITEITHLF
jgi:hypothetical protein